jgi:hypothetical protein
MSIRKSKALTNLQKQIELLNERILLNHQLMGKNYFLIPDWDQIALRKKIVSINKKTRKKRIK